MKMAQMGSPSKSLVGNSFQWTRSEISLDLYGPPKLNLLAGKIRARVFIRMIRNLPLTLAQAVRGVGLDRAASIENLMFVEGS